MNDRRTGQDEEYTGVKIAYRKRSLGRQYHCAILRTACGEKERSKKKRIANDYEMKAVHQTAVEYWLCTVM